MGFHEILRTSVLAKAVANTGNSCFIVFKTDELDLGNQDLPNFREKNSIAEEGVSFRGAPADNFLPLRGPGKDGKELISFKSRT